MGGKALSGLADLPYHAIVDPGRIAGLIRSEFGDARSFSLDSPATRRGRLDALRALQ